jgi:hypothetical protein
MAMVQALKDTIDKLKAFNYKSEVENIVLTNKDKLADLEAQQLYTGRDGDNKPILLNGRGYSPFTIQEKRKKGQVIDRVTWRDTGELYKTIFAQVAAGQFTLTSASFKWDKLIKRSGKKATELNEDSRNEFARNVAIPQFKEVFEQKTGLVIR